MSKNGKLTGYVLGRFSDNRLITRARQADEHIASLKAERAALLAQTQRDAAVIAKLVAAMRAMRAAVDIDPSTQGRKYALLIGQADAALLAAESRAEAETPDLQRAVREFIESADHVRNGDLQAASILAHAALYRVNSEIASRAEAKPEPEVKMSAVELLRSMEAGGHKAIRLLTSLADACDRKNDVGFWILTSAAAHLGGDHEQGEDGSTAENLFWQPRRISESIERLKREAAAPEVKS